MLVDVFDDPDAEQFSDLAVDKDGRYWMGLEKEEAEALYEALKVYFD